MQGQKRFVRYIEFSMACLPETKIERLQGNATGAVERHDCVLQVVGERLVENFNSFGGRKTNKCRFWLTVRRRDE
jgi:hypothetical protein